MDGSISQNFFWQSKLSSRLRSRLSCRWSIVWYIISVMDIFQGLKIQFLRNLMLLSRNPKGPRRRIHADKDHTPVCYSWRGEKYIQHFVKSGFFIFFLFWSGIMVWQRILIDITYTPLGNIFYSELFSRFFRNCFRNNQKLQFKRYELGL